jgi:hypothetical protein
MGGVGRLPLARERLRDRKIFGNGVVIFERYNIKIKNSE